MYNKSTNEITFPHIIPITTIDGKAYSWNDVDGGAKQLKEFGMEQNKFFGGNVEKLGLIKDLGMYACKRVPAQGKPSIIGFYVHDASELTKKGRDACKKAFPSAIIKFENYEKKVETPEEIKAYKALQKSYIDKGMSPALVHGSAEELAELERAMASGKAEKSLGVVAPAEMRNAKGLPPTE